MTVAKNRFPEGWNCWDWGPGQTEISQTNLNKNHIKISKSTGQDRSGRVYDTVTYCLWQTQTVCDRHIMSVTDSDRRWQKQTACDRKRLSVIDTDCLWRAKTICDRHRLFKTDTDCLWQTQTGCDLSNSLWKKKTLCKRQKLLVTDKDCLWQKKTVSDKLRLYVTDHCNFNGWWL